MGVYGSGPNGKKMWYDREDATPAEADIVLPELKADDVIKIIEKFLKVSKENYIGEYSIIIKGEGGEGSQRSLKATEDEAWDLAERLEMKQGGVQWYTPRRRIPFGPPQIFWVPKDDETTKLKQEHEPKDMTELPIPPTIVKDTDSKDSKKDSKDSKGKDGDFGKGITFTPAAKVAAA